MSGLFSPYEGASSPVARRATIWLSRRRTSVSMVESKLSCPVQYPAERVAYLNNAMQPEDCSHKAFDSNMSDHI